MIRRYRPDDLGGAAEVFRSAFAKEPWKEEWTAELAAERISQLMSAPRSVGYVSEEGGVIQAILCGRRLTYLHGDEYVIDEFCVSPSVQRQGTGTAVMEYAADEMRREGVVAMALMTTRMMVNRILLSISSRPYWSIFRAVRAIFVIFVSILPLPFTCAKSLTRRSKALAIRGVPRLLPAISKAASSVMGTLRIPAERSMILCSVSGS